MQGSRSLARSPVALALALFAGSPTEAQVLDAQDQGWYRDDGLQELPNANFLVGSQAYAGETHEYRSFFWFDRSAVAGPIHGACLVLWNPAPGYRSPDATETIELFDLPVNPVTVGRGLGGTTVFAELGSGTSFGSQVLTADDAKFISIPLNAVALAALNATADHFLLGAALTTLGPLADDEFAFGFSGALPRARLVLETDVPHSFLLIGESQGIGRFTTGVNSWTTQVGEAQDFYFLTPGEVPEFRVPGTRSRPLPPSGVGDASQVPEQLRDLTLPSWLLGRRFTAQVVTFSDDYPLQPEHFSTGIFVRFRPNGTVLDIPYGLGTGVVLLAQAAATPGTTIRLRFPFVLPSGS